MTSACIGAIYPDLKDAVSRLLAAGVELVLKLFDNLPLKIQKSVFWILPLNRRKPLLKSLSAKGIRYSFFPAI